MRRSAIDSDGKRRIDFAVSDLNSNSTCAKLEIPYDIACDHCKYKLDPLITRRVNKKEKNERQKSKRSRCQQIWDN